MRKFFSTLICFACLTAVAQTNVYNRIGFGGLLISQVVGGIEIGGTNEPPAENTLTNGVVAYWSLDSRSPWEDAMGTYTLEEMGAVTNATGIVGNAAGFNANTANYLRLSDYDPFSSVANSLTIAAWVKPAVTNAAMGIVSKNDNNVPVEWGMAWSASQSTFYFTFYTNGSTLNPIYASQKVVSPGNWYFVVAKVDQTNRVHSVRYASTSTLYPWNTSATWNGGGTTNGGNRVTIGRFQSTVMFNGLIDEVGVWNRLLTDQEITNLWNSGSGKAWPLN